MDENRLKFLEKHRDFLRQTAMSVFELVSTSDKRDYFRKQVEAFSRKVEEHQNELEEIKKTYEANPKLQEAAKKLDEQIKNAPVNEHGISNIEMHFDCIHGWGMLENFKDYVYYGGYWGAVAQTSDLVYYLKHFPDFHPGDFEKTPNEAERILCSYALLTIIHDKYVKEKPIFFNEPEYFYSSYPQHWKETIEQRCDCFNEISDGYFEPAKDTQDWIRRTLSDVKADLARTIDGLGLRELVGGNEANEPKDKQSRSISNLNIHFSEEDRLLFLQIAADIKAKSDKYKDAGQWLDWFCFGENEFWKAREIELKTCDCILSPTFDLNDDPVFKGKYKERKSELESMLKEKETPKYEDRLRDGWEVILGNFTWDNFLDKNRAHVALLIAWLITDADADKVNLGITKFENWPWSFLESGNMWSARSSSQRSFLRPSYRDPSNEDDHFKICMRLFRSAAVWLKHDDKGAKDDDDYNHCMEILHDGICGADDYWGDKYLDTELLSLENNLLREKGGAARENPEPADVSGVGKDETPKVPLSPPARAIYDKLCSLKPTEAMPLPVIQDWWYEKTKKDLDEGTFKKYRKELLSYGLKNKRRIGYYIQK